MRPAGFDSNDLCRFRSGLALSKARKRRVEAFRRNTLRRKWISNRQAFACEKSRLRGEGVDRVLDGLVAGQDFVQLQHLIER